MCNTCVILQFFPCPETFVLLQACVQSLNGGIEIFGVAGNGVLHFRLNHGGDSFQLLAAFPRQNEKDHGGRQS